MSKKGNFQEVEALAKISQIDSRPEGINLKFDKLKLSPQECEKLIEIQQSETNEIRLIMKCVQGRLGDF